MTQIIGANNQRQTQQVVLDPYEIIDDFFNKVMNSILMRMFIKTYSKDDAAKELDEVYEMNMGVFEQMMKGLATQNLTVYLELKKAIQASFENMKNSIMVAYDKKEEKNAGTEADETVRAQE